MRPERRERRKWRAEPETTGTGAALDAIPSPSELNIVEYAVPVGGDLPAVPSRHHVEHVVAARREVGDDVHELLLALTLESHRLPGQFAGPARGLVLRQRELTRDL